MKPMDSSDTTWLVYSDWLEENGQFDFAQEIRDEIKNTNNKHLLWNYEWISSRQVGGSYISVSVGGGGCGGIGVGVGDSDRSVAGYGVGGVGGSNIGVSGVGRVVGGG